mgnify:CR=1 FL=1
MEIVVKYLPDLMSFLYDYVFYMCVYFLVKYIVIGFLEGANIDIQIKHMVLYPIYMARDIGYVIGKIAIFLVGLIIT